MNKYELRLERIISDLDSLMWDVIDDIGDLDKEHELHAVLEVIADMYERYERDMEM